LIETYIVSLSEEELKSLSKKDLAGFTKHTDTILQKGSDISDPEHIERIRLQVALRWLKSPILEKRVNGILEIKEAITEAERASQFMIRSAHDDDYMDSDEEYDSVGFVSLLSDFSDRNICCYCRPLLDWIFNNNVIQFIFGPGVHLEVLRRSGDLIKFVAKAKRLTFQLVDLIWNLYQDVRTSPFSDSLITRI